MKRLVEEVSGEGLESLIGKQIDVWCMNYIYSGKLIGVNENDILLENCKLVYETGLLNDDSWKVAESFPNPRYVRVSAIESYGESHHD